jgi:hypothetical protein
MAELLNSFFKSVFNKKNKEKRFGQLGGNEDIVEIAPDKSTHEELKEYPMALIPPSLTPDRRRVPMEGIPAYKQEKWRIIQGLGKDREGTWMGRFQFGPN